MSRPSSASQLIRTMVTVAAVVLYVRAENGLQASADNATILQESSVPPARCADNYTMTCVKRDVLAVLDALDGERSYEIFSGFTVHQRRSSSASSYNESLDSADSARLDQLIMQRLNDYAESIDLRVKLLNPIDTTSRSVGTGVLKRILPFIRMSRKKKDHHGLYWTVGTMSAVGATVLMALSSKALMTAGAALAMAIYSCMKGGGGGGHGKGGGSHLTATLLEESTVHLPHRQCAEAVVDISGSYPVDVESYPGSRKALEMVSPVYRIHQTSDDYPSSHGSSQSLQQYP